MRSLANLTAKVDAIAKKAHRQGTVEPLPPRHRNPRLSNLPVRRPTETNALHVSQKIRGLPVY